LNVTLFVEGSHGEALKRTVVKSLVTIFSLLVPAAAVLYLCCERGCRPLYPCIRHSLRSVGFFAIKRIQKDVKGIVVLSGVIFGLVVGLGYLFMTIFGVVGVGYAWLVANGVGCVCVGAMVWGEGWV